MTATIETVSRKDISRRASRNFWTVAGDELILTVFSHRVVVEQLREDFWQAGWAAFETKAEAIKDAERQIVRELGYAPWSKQHAWKHEF